MFFFIEDNNVIFILRTFLLLVYDYLNNQ